MSEFHLEPEDKCPTFIDSYRVTRRLAVEQAEAEYTVVIDGHEVPFGRQNAQWRDLLSRIECGDELWLTTSSDEEWEALRGVEGILLVRNEKVVGSIITAFN
jgi:hypothetical protein